MDTYPDTNVLTDTTKDVVFITADGNENSYLVKTRELVNHNFSVNKLEYENIDDYDYMAFIDEHMHKAYILNTSDVINLYEDNSSRKFWSAPGFEPTELTGRDAVKNSTYAVLPINKIIETARIAGDIIDCF